ncbi:MAG: hypothetical protein JSR34_09850 [Proteobacteria bacterium]|nr:hypothetical protein [Pseudomonadota bacterium]
MSHHDSGTWILLLGPAGGIGFYWAMYRYYRNTDKSYDFEHEAGVDAKPVTGGEMDQKIGEITGTRESRVAGDNVREYRQRVQRVRGDSG